MAQARQRALAAGATLGATAVFAANAEAATYLVNSTADDGTGTCTESACTLRDAITTANANGIAGTTDTVDLSEVSGTITLDSANGVIGITDPASLDIDGPGPDTLTVSGGGETGIFQIDPDAGPVSISGLTLTAGQSESGGAIHNASAPLTLTNVTITGNAATVRGGGVYSERALTVVDSTITRNTAGGGGGIAAVGKYDVAIENSTISGNTAQIGGAIYSFLAAVSITDSLIDTNHATSSDGGGVFAIAGSLSLTGSTVSGNTSPARGGGIHSQTKYGTTIDSSTISTNTAANGGGLDVLGSFPGDTPDQNAVLVQDSTISGNGAPNGAGIEIGYASGSTPVTVMASTISGNQGGPGSSGGGVLIAGPLFYPFRLVNSTVSGNSATDGGGVGIGNSAYTLIFADGSIGFHNSTIAANTATDSGGGIHLGQYDADVGPESATAALDSTIVARNTAGGVPNDLFRPATSTSGGFNDTFSLIENPGNAPLLSSQALITGVDPQLGPLTGNGGPTETMLPSNTSPAIDQGRALTGLTTDQRGEPRTVDNGRPVPPGGDGTDIGAVELPPIPPPPPPLPAPPDVAVTTPPPSVVVVTQCRSRRQFTIRLIERRGRVIRSAKVFVRGKRVAVLRRRSDHRLVADVDLRGLPKGTYRVVLEARLRDGRSARWVRSYRTCIGRLPPSNDLDNPRAL